MRTASQGSARLPRRGDRRRHLRSAPAQPRRHRRAGILAPGRRQGLARHGPGRRSMAAMNARSSNAMSSPRRCASPTRRRGAFFFRRRPPERPGAAEIRAGKYQDGHPAAHSCRGEVCFAIGMSEPNSGSDLFAAKTPRHQDRRWLPDQRHQDLDFIRAYRRLHDRDLPHVAAHEREPPPRPDAIFWSG